MNLGYLEYIHKKWRDILVIGRTIEHEGRQYHILGMTLAEEAKLYIIEPYERKEEKEGLKRQGPRNQRRLLREQEETEPQLSYLHCREVCIGKKKLRIQGGTGSPLEHMEIQCDALQVFFDMLGAGWSVPDWLKETDFNNLQLVTLEVADIKRLPKYSPEMPITIKHDRSIIRHRLEKTVKLQVGKGKSFHFTDSYGEKVQCYINDIVLVDFWKDMEERFKDPRYTEHFSPEEIEEVKKRYCEALEQSCPKGMRYAVIECECSKKLHLEFYTKEYLKSYPKESSGSASALLINWKPEKEKGRHNLSLRGTAIQSPVAADTTEIPAELFYYQELLPEWEETV